MNELSKGAQELLALDKELKRTVEEKWQRRLPLSELPRDRFTEAQRLQFGEGSSVSPSCLLDRWKSGKEMRQRSRWLVHVRWAERHHTGRCYDWSALYYWSRCGRNS